MNREIIIDKNMQELTPHGDYGFPFLMLSVLLSDYPFYSYPAHWHSNIEITYVEDGEMSLIVNQSCIHLKKGDCLVINANILHAGEQYLDSDCKYKCVVFNPVIIYGFKQSLLEQKYIGPILENNNFAYTLFTGNTPEHQEIIALMTRLTACCEQDMPGQELLIQSVLSSMWYQVYLAYEKFLVQYGASMRPSREKELQRLKNALTFIYDHYSEPITLDEIAASCHTSKSAFCRMFKKIMHQTPFDYLLRYRIEKSLPLLCSKDYTVTEVATMAGFSTPSYFAEIFRKYMQSSPTQYRKQYFDSQEN